MKHGIDRALHHHGGLSRRHKVAVPVVDEPRADVLAGEVYIPHALHGEEINLDEAPGRSSDANIGVPVWLCEIPRLGHDAPQTLLALEEVKSAHDGHVPAEVLVGIRICVDGVGRLQGRRHQVVTQLHTDDLCGVRVHSEPTVVPVGNPAK